MGKGVETGSAGHFVTMIICLGLSLLITVIGVRYLFDPIVNAVSYPEEVKAVVVEEVITEHRTKSKHGRSVYYNMYEAVVQYEYDGKTYTAKSGNPVHSESRVPVGRSVNIHIDPKSPENINYPKEGTQYLSALVCIIFGVMFGIIGASGLKKAIEARREDDGWETE